jgi:hypothetical protein
MNIIPAQKRRLVTVLCLIEKNLRQEERLLQNHGEDGILYEILDTVGEGRHPTILAQIVKLRQCLALAKDRFGLAREQSSLRHRLVGEFNLLWVWLQDLKAEKLASYGVVDRTLERDLDPLVMEMATLIDQTLAMLEEEQEGGESHGL